jgi:TolA-binding protein
MKRINNFLDRYVLPWPVRYLSHRFVILLTIALLIPLVVYASKQVLVLLVNSYLNTMSVAVSSIVLLYATISEVHQKQIAELQEERAQEDHIHVVEMHSLMQESLANQQGEIEGLREMIASLQGTPYHPRKVQDRIDLRELHPRGSNRFEADDTKRRLGEHLHRHATTEQVHEEIVANKATAI